MTDSIERVLKIGIWITATIFFSWTWINLLNSMSFITGLGFDSLLMLLSLVFFYYLKQMLHLEFTMSKTIEPESVIINIPREQYR